MTGTCVVNDILLIVHHVYCCRLCFYVSLPVCEFLYVTLYTNNMQRH